MKITDYEIELIPVERKCPYNEEARIKGKPLLLDYKVLINGEHRADWIRWDSIGRRYDLKTPNGADVIVYGDRGLASEWKQDVVAKSKKDFDRLLEQALSQNTIPTIEELERERAERAHQAREENRRAARAAFKQTRDRKLMRAAPGMLKICKLLLGLITNDNEWKRELESVIPNLEADLQKTIKDLYSK